MKQKLPIKDQYNMARTQAVDAVYYLELWLDSGKRPIDLDKEDYPTKQVLLDEIYDYVKTVDKYIAELTTTNEADRKEALKRRETIDGWLGL